MRDSTRCLLVFIVLVLLNGFLLWPLFFPGLTEIDKDDETWYINSGRSLVYGHLPEYARSPLSAFFYALIYLPLENSPSWLLHSCSVGRIVFFVSLWVSFGLITAELEKSICWTARAVLFISPVLVNILWNPADCLFTIFSGLCFWQILLFIRQGRQHHLGIASSFLGLAALARVDGLALFIVFMIIVMLISRPVTLRNVTIASMPFLIILTLFGVLYWNMPGETSPKIGERAYLAFEQGQGVVQFSETRATGNVFFRGQVEARALYGTAEQNEYSIFRAIRRNPSAYKDRFYRNVVLVPDRIVTIYGQVHGHVSSVKGFGKFSGLIFVLLALRGVIALLEQKNYLMIALLGIWSLHLSPYLLTFFRNGYFLLIYFILLYLTALGIQEMFVSESRSREKAGWSLVLTMFIIFGFLYGMYLLLFGSLIFLASLWLIWLVQRAIILQESSKSTAIVLFICLVLCLRGSFPVPQITYHNHSEQAAEKVVQFLRLRYAPLTKVVGASTPVLLQANMEVSNPFLALQEIRTTDAFHDWLTRNDVRVILLDQVLASEQPHLLDLVLNMPGEYFCKVYDDTVNNVRIFEKGADPNN